MPRSKNRNPKKRPQTPKAKRSHKINYIIRNMQGVCSAKVYGEIRDLQKSTNLLIPRMPFARVVREVMMQFSQDGIEYKIQSLALEALQEATEKYLVGLLQDANMCTAHAKRSTLLPRDIRLILDARGLSDPGYYIK